MERFLTLCGPMVWPLSTLVIALIFRRDVGQALGRIGQVRYRDLELTFRDDLHQAERLARSIPPPAATKAPLLLEVAPDEAKPLGGRLIVTPSAGEGQPSAAELTGRPPREAVEVAWEAVVRALAKAAKAQGDRRTPASTSSELATRFLVDRGRLAPGEGMLVGLLRTLRDRAARLDQAPPSADDARRFVDLALRLASRIDEVA